jgi:hypothetical protein
MKNKMTFGLAALILTLTLSAFPNRAAATTTADSSTPVSELTRASGDSKVKYMAIVLTAGSLLFALVP